MKADNWESNLDKFCNERIGRFAMGIEANFGRNFRNAYICLFCVPRKRPFQLSVSPLLLCILSLMASGLVSQIFQL